MEITDFKYKSDLVLLRYKDKIEGLSREAQYVLAEDYTFSFNHNGVTRTLTVPKGMLTDLASVPRIFRWLVGRVGRHLEAAIIHDWYFIRWQDLDLVAMKHDFIFANKLMNAAMIAANVPKWKRWVIMAAVMSPIGWQVYKGENPEPRYVDVNSNR